MDSRFINRFVVLLTAFFYLQLSIRSVLPCVSKSGWGWGHSESLYFPPPTLFPKLKAAFLEGKAHVAWNQPKHDGHGHGWSNVGHAVPVSYGPGPAKGENNAPIVINGLGWGDASPQRHSYDRCYYANPLPAPVAQDFGRGYYSQEPDWSKAPPVKKSVKRRRHKPKSPPRSRSRGVPRLFPVVSDFPFNQ